MNKKREHTKLKPEVIKQGLNINVDWFGDGSVYYPGEVIRKLRKNWLVEAKPHYSTEHKKTSVPYDRMTINTGFTKEGRPLMATKEDSQYMFSKEHIDYCKSLCVEVPGKTIVNEEGICV